MLYINVLLLSILCHGFHIFVPFLLVISMFKMSPGVVEVLSDVPKQTRPRDVPCEEKHVCYMSFIQARVMVLSATEFNVSESTIYIK